VVSTQMHRFPRVLEDQDSMHHEIGEDLLVKVVKK
jgi:hypothetical protein